MRKILLFVLAAATFAGASPAIAAEVTIRISLEGLDVADPADELAILDRIDSAVSSRCKSGMLIFAREAVAECKADGTAKALAELEAIREGA